MREAEAASVSTRCWTLASVLKRKWGSTWACRSCSRDSRTFFSSWWRSASALAMRAWSRACLARRITAATTTQPNPIPRPMLIATPTRRSVSMLEMSRPLTKPARIVPSTEPAITANTCMASRGIRVWRTFPAIVNSTMLT